MKTTLYLILAGTLLVLSCASQKEKQEDMQPNDITGNFYLPPLAKVGEGAYVRGELIYPLDDKPTPECHASTIVNTPSGLVAAFFAGTHERHPDVGIRVTSG